jgi:magnesium-transporting ATPase (P-type)
MDQGQQEISSMPRARVSKIRPHDSIFHPSSALSILLQSICHLFTLTYGHHAATLIEKKYGDSFNKGVTVRLINPELFGPIGELFKSSTCAKDGKVNIFGRTPFKPNHVTNSVFILSCFQNTIISLVNHIGAPFHGRVFESRTFCFWICASFLFCVAAATESFPPLNKLLELAPMPSKQSKILILSLMVFDGLISFVADRLCIFLLDRRRWNEMAKPEKVSRGKGHAADLEEDLLCQERNMNKAMSLLFGLVGLVLALTSI